MLRCIFEAPVQRGCKDDRMRLTEAHYNLGADTSNGGDCGLEQEHWLPRRTVRRTALQQPKASM